MSGGKNLRKLKSEARRYREQMLKEVNHMASALDRILDVPEAADFLARAESPLVKVSLTLEDGTHFVADERQIIP